MQNIVIKIVIRLLRSINISIENRNALTSVLLDKLVAIPSRDIISIDGTGTIIVNDRSLDPEMARLLRDSSRSVLDSTARKVVREQVAFRAVNIGLHKGKTAEDLLFSKAAIWWGQQEDELYRFLAQQE